MNNTQDTNPTCRALTVSPRQWSAESPPPYHAIAGIPQPLHRHLPYIAAMTANNLNAVCSHSIVYCYLYNRCMLNNMQSNDWRKLFEAVVFHTWYNINSRNFQDEEAALKDALTNVIMVYASHIAVGQPAMQTMLDAATANEVFTIAQRWQIFANEYQRLEANTQQQVQQAQQYNNNQQSSGLNGWQQNTGQAGWAAPNQPVASATTPGGMGSMIPSMTFENRLPDAPAVPAGNEMFSAAYRQTAGLQGSARQDHVAPKTGNRRSSREIQIPGLFDDPVDTSKIEDVTPKTPAAAKFVPTATEIVNGNVEVRPLGLHREATAGEWVPIPHQPYHPAFTDREVPFYQYMVDSQGLQRVVVTINQKDPAEMNQQEHTLSNAGGMFRQFRHKEGVTEQSVQLALSATAQALVSQDLGENPEATQLYKSLGIIGNEPYDIGSRTSIEDAIAEARCVRLLSCEVGSTFLTSTFLKQSIVTKIAPAVLFARLQTCKTFAEAVTELNDYGRTVATKEGYQAVEAVNRVIRRELLDIIRFRFGTGGAFNFTSFMEDHVDLASVLNNDYGQLYLKAYNAIQPLLLATLFNPNSISIQELETEPEADDPAQSVGFVTTVAPNATVLLIDIDHQELGIQLPIGACCEVFPDTYPGLHGFIQSVVQSSPGALHHYVVTADDVIYEVSIGLIGADHMVMRRLTDL